MGVVRPLRVVLENYPEGQDDAFDAPWHPEDPAQGARKLPLLARRSTSTARTSPRCRRRAGSASSPGAEVRLRYACIIKCERVVKDDEGEVVELRCTWDPDSRGGNAKDGRKIKGTLHWVSEKHGVPAEVRLYDRLFKTEHPGEEEGDDFLEDLNPESLRDRSRGARRAGARGAAARASACSSSAWATSASTATRSRARSSSTGPSASRTRGRRSRGSKTAGRAHRRRNSTGGPSSPREAEGAEDPLRWMSDGAREPSVVALSRHYVPPAAAGPADGARAHPCSAALATSRGPAGHRLDWATLGVAGNASRRESRKWRASGCCGRGTSPVRMVPRR